MGCGLEGGFYENACAILCSIFYRAGVPYVETSIRTVIKQAPAAYSTVQYSKP